MQFSISTGYYLKSQGPDVSLEQCLESIRTTEFGAEISFADDGARILQDPFRWSVIRNLCAEMPALSAHSGYSRQRPFSEFLQEMDFCEQVGVDLMVCHPKAFGIAGPTWAYDGPVLSPDNTQCIERAISEAASRSLRLAIENGPASALDQAMAATTSHPHRKHFGVCIDTGHANMHRDRSDSPVLDILRDRDRIIHVHVHDNHGAQDDHLVPGEGVGDWKGIFRELGRLGYNANIVFELASDTPIDAARRAKSFVLAHLDA